MFTLNGYKIVFRRRWQNKCTDFNGKYLLGDGRYDTVCEIYTRDKTMVGKGFEPVFQKNPSFTGIAKLHPNDRPDKIVGKKIALRNALGSRKFSGDPEPAYNCVDFYCKAVRSVIWAAFSNWVSQWPHQVAPKPIV